MNSAPRVLTTVHTAGGMKFGLPVPLESKGITRAGTVFHIVAEDQSISFLGTYDQLLDFAAEIGQKVLSWPIVSGRSDWFGQKANAEQGNEDSSGNRYDDTDGREDGYGRSQDESGDGDPTGRRGSGTQSVPG